MFAGDYRLTWCRRLAWHHRLARQGWLTWLDRLGRCFFTLEDALAQRRLGRFALVGGHWWRGLDHRFILAQLRLQALALVACFPPTVGGALHQLEQV
ncbi:hypothetical protein D3C78_1431610 [compost metagenome]